MRTAVIGGASRGLGYACAAALAAQGCRIILCARSEAGLREAVERLTPTASVPPIALPCDLAARGGVQQLRELLESRQLAADILVNNIGGPVIGSATVMTEEQWQRAFEHLFLSTVRLYSLVLPHMREQRWGRIVNILSTVVREPMPHLALSSVLRAAVASYAKLVALDVAHDGITVNSIMPAGFATERTLEVQRAEATQRMVPLERVQAEAVARIPVGRLLEPEELGELTAYLVSSGASGMTGSLLSLDGGQLTCI